MASEQRGCPESRKESDEPTGHSLSRRRRSRLALASTWLALCLWVLGVLSVSRPASAQTSPSTSQVTEAITSQPAGASTELPKSSEIELLQKQAAESTDLSEDVKKQIDLLCKAALEGLKQIADLTAAAAQFKTDAESAARRAEELKQKLETLKQAEPVLPEVDSFAELEQEISQRQLLLEKLEADLAKIVAEVARRPKRESEIVAALIDVEERLEAARKELEVPAPEDTPPLLLKAQRNDLLVRIRVLEVQPAALNAELSKIKSERAANILRLQQDTLNAQISVVKRELELLERQRSADQSAERVAAAIEAEKELEAAPAYLRSYAKENLQLAEAAEGLNGPIEQARRQLAQAKAELEDLQKQFKTTKDRVNDIGVTPSVGSYLRRQRLTLPDIRDTREHLETRRRTIEEYQYRFFDLEEKRSNIISDREEELNQLLPQSSGDEAEREQIRTVASNFIDRRVEYLDLVQQTHQTYLSLLFELDVTEQKLIEEAQAYSRYIDERVLWIRSNRDLFTAMMSGVSLDESDWEIIDPRLWRGMMNLLLRDMQSHLVIYGLGLLLLATLLLTKPRARRRLTLLGEDARRGSCCRFSPTVLATVVTIHLAMFWAALLWFFGWRLANAAGTTAFAYAAAKGLQTVAQLVFLLEFLRQCCRTNGLVDAHFAWPKSAITVLRRNLRWLTLTIPPLAFVSSMLFFLDPEHGQDILERLCFIAMMLVLSYCLMRIIHPERGMFHEYLRARQTSWLGRLKHVWYWACVGTPLVFACLTIAGYFYTAFQLSARLFLTFVVIVAGEFVRAFLLRLLLVQRRRISIEHARQRRAALLEAAMQGDGNESPSPIADPAKSMEHAAEDVADNSAKTERLAHTFVVAIVVACIYVIWIQQLPALRILDKVGLWTTSVTEVVETVPVDPTSPTLESAPIQETRQTLREITLGDLLVGLIIALITVVCFRNVPGLMEIFVLERLPLDRAMRYAITTITSYFIAIVGIILGFNAIGIGWSKIQWLATALTFGLAFGLQEIFANFVAGLILLFERPIRVGDIVTIDTVTGSVSRIQIRATTITDWDRKEYVVPNREFITGRVLNWTLTNTINRVVINVGIVYGSDVDKAKAKLMECIEQHQHVLKDPPPIVTFESFGDYSLNLVARLYLGGLENRLATIDDLHRAINNAFRDADVEIAFPTRDLNLRSVNNKVLGLLQREDDYATRD